MRNQNKYDHNHGKHLQTQRIPLKHRYTKLAVFTIVVGWLAACSNKPTPASLPDVNDENCKSVNLAKIEDKGNQQAFASLCLRRGGTSVPSKPREW